MTTQKLKKIYILLLLFLSFSTGKIFADEQCNNLIRTLFNHEDGTMPDGPYKGAKLNPKKRPIKVVEQIKNRIENTMVINNIYHKQHFWQGNINVDELKSVKILIHYNLDPMEPPHTMLLFEFAHKENVSLKTIINEEIESFQTSSLVYTVNPHRAINDKIGYKKNTKREARFSIVRRLLSLERLEKSITKNTQNGIQVDIMSYQLNLTQAEQKNFFGDLMNYSTAKSNKSEMFSYDNYNCTVGIFKILGKYRDISLVSKKLKWWENPALTSNDWSGLINEALIEFKIVQPNQVYPL